MSIDDGEVCCTCHFFKSSGLNGNIPGALIGTCRRYPVYLPRNVHEWCGEYQTADFLKGDVEVKCANA